MFRTEKLFKKRPDTTGFEPVRGTYIRFQTNFLGRRKWGSLTPPDFKSGALTTRPGVLVLPFQKGDRASKQTLWYMKSLPFLPLKCRKFSAFHHSSACANAAAGRGRHHAHRFKLRGRKKRGISETSNVLCHAAASQRWAKIPLTTPQKLCPPPLPSPSTNGEERGAAAQLHAAPPLPHPPPPTATTLNQPVMAACCSASLSRVTHGQPSALRRGWWRSARRWAFRCIHPPLITTETLFYPRSALEMPRINRTLLLHPPTS